MRNCVIPLLIVLCLMTGSLARAGNPHTVYGTVLRSDGSGPAEGMIRFKAYIAGRPREILTENSPGCLYKDGWFQVGIGNFPTPWKEGDMIVIELTGPAGSSACLEKIITGTDPDRAADILLDNK